MLSASSSNRSPSVGLTVVDIMAGRRIKAFASYAQAFREKPQSQGVSEGLRPVAGQGPVLADRRDHLAVPAVLPLHVDRDQRMRRGHQQQDMENQAENQAKHDQDQVEDRRKRLPVQQQPERRQHGGKNVDHPTPSSGWRGAYQRYAGFRWFAPFRNGLCDGGMIQAPRPPLSPISRFRWTNNA